MTSLCRRLRGGLSVRETAALLYNAIQTAGWLYAASSLDSAVRWDVLDVDALANRTFSSAGPPIVAMQTLALVEPLLCLLGIIPSAMSSVVLQIVVRNVVILLAVNRHAVLQNHVSVFMFFFAWMVTELVRFPWLILKITAGEPPQLLTLVRYTLPLMLYPLGGAGELWTMWRARTLVGDGDVLSVAGFTVTLGSFVTYVYLPMYIPGFCLLYYQAFRKWRKTIKV